MVFLNPEGYKSEYLARIQKVIVFVNMKRFIMSKGSFIECDHVEFQKLEVIYEKHMLSQSNVDHVMNFIEGEEEVEAGYLQQGIAKVAHTVENVEAALARTVAHTAHFVSDEARHVVDEMAPEPVQRMYSMVAHTAEGVLTNATAVAGTTVAATSAVIEGATHVTIDTACSITAHTAEAARSVAETAGNAVVAAGSAAATPFSRRKSVRSDGSPELRRRPSTCNVTSVPSVRRRLSATSFDTPELQKVPDTNNANVEQDPEEWFLLHRAIATDITVRVASTAFRGAGMHLIVPDLDIKDCADQVEFDTALDVSRFLMRSLLETVHQKVAFDLSSILDVAKQTEEAMESVGRQVIGG